MKFEGIRRTAPWAEPRPRSVQCCPVGVDGVSQQQYKYAVLLKRKYRSVSFMTLCTCTKGMKIHNLASNNFLLDATVTGISTSRRISTVHDTRRRSAFGVEAISDILHVQAIPATNFSQRNTQKETQAHGNACAKYAGARLV